LTHARERRLDQLFGAPLDAAERQQRADALHLLEILGAARGFRPGGARNFWPRQRNFVEKEARVRFFGHALLIPRILRRASDGALQLFARVETAGS